MDTGQIHSFIEDYLQHSSQVTLSLRKQTAEIASIAEALYGIANSGGRIYSCGNGGSACDAMHLAEELVARYLRERPGIRAQHLIDSGTMTCWANDYDFDSVFRRQVETLMNKDDALVVFTTSGNSENVIQAVEAANQIGGLSIAFTGRDGGRVKEAAKYSFIVDSDRTAYIQEAHMALVHIICDVLEQRLFPDYTSTEKS